MGDLRIWWARPRDAPFILYLLKRFRAHEFFFAPDYVIEREISRGNILCFDYRGLGGLSLGDAARQRSRPHQSGGRR